MNILFLTNNNNTAPLLNWLKIRNNVGLFSGEITTKFFAMFSKPDWIISYNYQHIINEDVLKLMPRRVINLHIGYLPFNRGSHPNVWSFIEDTPVGITIHEIDKGLDKGAILLQEKVVINPELHTFKTSYDKLNCAIQELLVEFWSSLVSNSINPYPQVGKGTYHSKKDFDAIEPLMTEGWDTPIYKVKGKT